MRITESTLRRIIREEIVGQAVREGRMSPRQGRRLVEGGQMLSGNEIVDRLSKVDKSQAERIAGNTHFRRNMDATFEVNRQGNGDIAFYTADGKTFIESIPMEIAKKANIAP